MKENRHILKLCCKKEDFFVFWGVIMKKIDARIRYTRRVLKDAFLTLLKQKPVNKITVKEVCELAELNRATFYTHYSDCFALLESIEQDILDAFLSSIKLINSFDMTALIEAIYAMVEQHEEACRILIFQGASTTVLQRMIDIARMETISVWKQRLYRADDNELEMLYTHLSSGLLSVIKDGFDKYSREEITCFVNKIVKCSLSQWI